MNNQEFMDMYKRYEPARRKIEIDLNNITYDKEKEQYIYIEEKGDSNDV